MDEVIAVRISGNVRRSLPHWLERALRAELFHRAVVAAPGSDEDPGAGGRVREQEDERLARALMAGSPGAERAAWRRFAPSVRQLVKRILNDGPEVDDFVQEVFLCFFERVVTLQDPKALRAFILSITVNVTRGEVRRRALRRIFLLDEPDPPLPAHPDPEAREALVHFYRILDRMGADDRTAFVLRFVHEMELTEMATVLDTSLSTVKRRLVRTWDRFALAVARDPALSHYLSSKEWESPSRST